MADYALKISIGLDGVPQVTGGLNQVESAMDNMGSKSAAATGRMAGGMGDADAASGRMAAGLNKLGYSVDAVIGYVEKALAVFGLFKVAEFAKDTMMLAARYETLGVVMNVVGKNAGYTQSQMDGFQAGLQKTGISAIESRQGLALMAQAQIDFANSSKLARIAQDAAVIGNINSSEAFNRMMTGLSTGQSILMHHLGLMTNFEQAYLDAAHAVGKTANDLTNSEKAQIRVNEVIRAGAGIAGSYEAAMGTVGKQLTSMPRYINDLMVKIGSMGQGPLFTLVSLITNSLKTISKNFEEISSVASTLATGSLITFLGIATSKSLDFAASVALSSQQSQALRMNTIFNAEALAASTAATVAETNAKVAANQARIASINSYIAESQAEFTSAARAWGRAAADEKLIAFDVARTNAAIALAASETALAAAETEAAAASSALTVAQYEASIAGRVMTGVVSGLNTVMSLVGGPIGMIAIGIATVTYEIIKFLDRANEAQRNLNAFENQGDFSQTLQKLKEIEKLNKQMEDAKKSPAEQAKSNAAEMQDKINKAVKNNIELEQQRQVLIKSGNATRSENTFSGKLTEWDKVNAKITDNNNLIKYGTQINNEMTLALAKQATLRDAMKTTKPAGSVDPEKQAKYDKQVLDARAALAEQYRVNEKAHDDAAVKDRLAQFAYEKDMGLKTTQQYLDAKFTAEKTTYTKELAEANKVANAAYVAYSKQWDKPGTDSVIADQELKKYEEAYGKAQAIADKITAIQNQKPRDDAKHISDMQHFADEMAIQRLQVQGHTRAAENAQNELKYSDLRKKGYTADEIGLQRSNDLLKQQEDAKTRLISAQTTLSQLYSQNAQMSADMVGRNAQTGNIDDQYAHDLATMKAASDAKIAQINLEIAAYQRLYDLMPKGTLIAAAAADQITEKEKEKALTIDKAVIDSKVIATTAYRSQLSAASQYTGMAGQLFTSLASTQDQSSRAGFESAKSLNIASAIMSTAAAVMNAFATMPWPMAPIAAGLAAATGAIQIAKIASTTFGGGSGSVSAPSGSYASGGASGGGSVSTGSAVGAPITSIQDQQTSRQLQVIADTIGNAALAMGKSADSLYRIAESFKSGTGSSIGVGAPNQYTTVGDATNGVGWASNIGDGAKIGAVIGTALGAIFGTIPGAIAGAYAGYVTSAYQSMFGHGAWTQTGAGIQMQMANGQLYSQNYVDSVSKGGWFTSDRHNTTVTDSDSQFVTKLNAELAHLQEGLRVSTVAMGMSTSKMDDAINSTTLGLGRIATAGRTSEQISTDIGAAFVTMSNQIITQAIPKIADYAISSAETATDTYYRLAAALMDVTAQFSLVGKTITMIGIDGANAAYGLQQLFGGADKMATDMDDYFTSMYSNTEQTAMKAAYATTTITSAFMEMGLKVPKTAEEFNALRNSVTDPALIVALTQLGPTFAEITKQVEAVTTFNNDLTTRQMALAGKDTTLFALRVKQEQEMKDAISGGMDTQRLAIVQNGEWAAAVAKATNAVSNSVVTLASATSAASAQIDKQLSILNTLNGIKSASDNLSPEAAYTQAVTAFQTSYAAKNYDTISSASTALLTASRAFNASGATYQADYYAVTAALQEMGTAGISSSGNTSSDITTLTDLKNAINGTGTDSLLYGINTLATLMAAFNESTKNAQQDAATQTYAKALGTYQSAQVGLMSQFATGTMSADNYKNKDAAAYAPVSSAYAAATKLGVTSISAPPTTLTDDELMQIRAGSLSDHNSASWKAMQMANGALPYDTRYDIATQNGVRILDGKIGNDDILTWIQLGLGHAHWSSLGLPAFANGGITSGPSIAGEGMYPEAIIPLPDGRTVPVKMTGGADNRESIAELKEAVAELKQQNRLLMELLNVSKKGHSGTIKAVEKSGASTADINKARLKVTA